ncbi:MAG TPA: 4-alpha-glucanotransferase [Gemmatimonadaceae bacterium]
MSSLSSLADRVGILPEYVGHGASGVCATSDETRVALLAAMGIDASTEERAREALDALDAREAAQLIERVRVVAEPRAPAHREHTVERPMGHAVELPLRLPDAWSGAPLDWTMELHDEGGAVHRASGSARNADAEMALPLPVGPAPGYHTVRLHVRAAHEEREAEQTLIVTPSSCVTPAGLLGGRRVFGITANLYTIRSARNWGVGDLTDLRDLAVWSAEVGADFIGVNPLHALRNHDSQISPYSPVSRLFRNVLYLDVEAVPELAESAEAREMLARRDVREALRSVHASERVEYERVMALKRPVLELLHRTFARAHRGTADARGAAYARYLEQQGRSLTTFATFLALDEHVAAERGGRACWREWPAPYRDPRSPEVARFRDAHREQVDFHSWLQFELDRQLEAAARAGVDAGMAVGLYQDLAIGSAGDGSDTWAFPELFVMGASIGAPPDPLAPQGQNWALPPLDPGALRDTGYHYWRFLLRAALAHAGALRIDHVMGLFRQFWIAEGMPGSQGAYVRFPAHDLLGILALESVRHRALIVGEDLGTVPPEVPRAMHEWGILGSRVLYFERDHAGDFRGAASYPSLSLATANTHDLPTIEGFWCGRDIALRREVGLITSDDVMERARAERARDRQALVRRLEAEHVLPAGAAEPRDAELRGAVHEFLCRTPAALVGISLDDLVGETEPVNLPGVTLDVYPSWQRRLHTPLDALRDDADVATSLRCSRANASNGSNARNTANGSNASNGPNGPDEPDEP